jgi:hypothetical protein
MTDESQATSDEKGEVKLKTYDELVALRDSDSEADNQDFKNYILSIMPININLDGLLAAKRPVPMLIEKISPTFKKRQFYIDAGDTEAQKFRTIDVSKFVQYVYGLSKKCAPLAQKWEGKESRAVILLNVVSDREKIYMDDLITPSFIDKSTPPAPAEPEVKCF